MDFLARFFLILIEAMSQEITIYGFTFSLWGVFVFTILAGIIFRTIDSIFD